MGADVQRFDIARKLRRLAMDDWHKPNGIDPYRKLLQQQTALSCLQGRAREATI